MGRKAATPALGHGVLQGPGHAWPLQVQLAQDPLADAAKSISQKAAGSASSHCGTMSLGADHTTATLLPCGPPSGKNAKMPRGLNHWRATWWRGWAQSRRVAMAVCG